MNERGPHPPSAVAPSLRLGLEALHSRHPLKAMAHFEALLRRARHQPDHSLEAVSLSYYGLALALHAPQRRDALAYCERAVQFEFFNPDLYLNLARVQLIHGNRMRAYEAILRGLSLCANHPGLLRQLHRRLGTRRISLVPFLQRAHPLNVFFGRLRQRLLPA
ncbi:MAG: hypothetical protein V3U98_09630 [Acidobacteriota bacterium]